MFAGKHHWICVYRLAGEDCIKVLDTMQADLNEHTLLQLSSLYKPLSGSTLHIIQLPIQQQKGVHDCGVFAIANMIEVIKGGKITRINFDQFKMRKHLEVALSSGTITEFPKTRKITQRCESQEFKEEVFCICKMPECYDMRMITCDVCSCWYHFKCVNLKKGRKSWVCPNCQPSRSK